MKSIALFSFLILHCVCLFAQHSPTYTFQGGYLFFKGTDGAQYLQAFRYEPIDTIGYLRISQIATTVFPIKRKPGFYISAKIHFPFDTKMNIITGIDLNFYAFEYTSEFRGFSNPFLGPDTTFVETIDIFEPLVCDEYSNAPSDFTIDPRVKNRLLYIRIPLNMEISKFNGRLKLLAGFYFERPLFTTIRSEYLSLNQTTVIDEVGASQTSCIYSHIKNKDKSGDIFRNFIWGGNFGVAVRIRPQIFLDFNASIALRNMYDKTRITNLYNTGVNNRWSLMSLGLRYELGHKNQKSVELLTD